VEQREVIVEREAVEVMFRRVSDDQAGISSGMAEVEAAVGLRGRRYYGAFQKNGEYLVCVALRDGDDPASYGLERGQLPGGRYARVRLEGEPPGVYQQIAPSFHLLSQRSDHDPSRPDIEYYRRRDQIDLLLPIT
jgi:hypothetical protein